MFVCFLKICLDYDNTFIKNCALMALNNPIPYADNNYKQMVRKYGNVLKILKCAQLWSFL